MGCVGPSLAEADVAQTDTGPGEQGAERTNRKKPVEDCAVDLQVGKESQETDARGEEDGDEGTALAIDIGKDLRSMGLLSQSSEGTRRAKDSRVTDADDRNENNGVHDAGENRGSGALDGNNKGTRRGIRAVLTSEETTFVGGHEQADEHQGDDVEDGDAPEDLLDGGRERLAGVSGFGSSETDKFCASEREGAGDEDAAEAPEAVVEGAGVSPVLATDVAAFWLAADVDDNGKETGLIMLVETRG